MRGESDAPRTGRPSSVEAGVEPRVDDAAPDRDRGQTQLLGYVLLVAIVAVGSVAVLLFGGAGLEATESAVEVERAERSLLEFTHATRTVTDDGERRIPVAIDGLERGAVETRADAGRVRIVRENGSRTEVLYDEPLGTVRYANGDTVIASQGGGLWRSDGDGSVAVSAPPLEYRDDTLRFPVVRLVGTEARGDGIDGVVSRSAAPERVAYRSGDVRIGIESAYCEGWEREIESTVPGGITERCSAGKPDRVRFELTDPPDIGGIDAAVAAREVAVHRNAPRIEGDVRAASVDDDRVNGSVSNEGYDYPSADGYVDGRLEGCTEFDDLDAVVDAGRYCVDRIDGGHAFDTSAGNVTVVVRDSVDLRGADLRHEGDGHLTVLVDGPVSLRGNAVVGNGSDPGRTKLLVSSDGDVTTAAGSPTVSGLLYAPDSTVSLQGNPTVRGSVVGDRVAIGNVRPGGVAYDGRVGDAALAPGGPRLRHFGVTAYEVSFEE